MNNNYNIQSYLLLIYNNIYKITWIIIPIENILVYIKSILSLLLNIFLILNSGDI